MPKCDFFGTFLGGLVKTVHSTQYTVERGEGFFFGDLYDVFLGYLLIETSYGLNFFSTCRKVHKQHFKYSFYYVLTHQKKFMGSQSVEVT